jgi:hypothetical protein
VKIELDLTQREADELLRAEFKDRSGRSIEGQCCVQRELESAAIKLRAAIDKAIRS